MKLNFFSSQIVIVFEVIIRQMLNCDTYKRSSDEYTHKTTKDSRERGMEKTSLIKQKSNRNKENAIKQTQNISNICFV